jgi:hypothetical protein
VPIREYDDGSGRTSSGSTLLTGHAIRDLHGARTSGEQSGKVYRAILSERIWRLTEELKARFDKAVLAMGEHVQPGD